MCTTFLPSSQALPFVLMFMCLQLMQLHSRALSHRAQWLCIVTEAFVEKVDTSNVSGGLCWCRIDGDAVLMRDVYPITVLVGYQFAMRWMNAHIFYVKKGSPLSKRILDITRTMPLTHPDFTTTIVDKVCRPQCVLDIGSRTCTQASDSGAWQCCTSPLQPP